MTKEKNIEIEGNEGECPECSGNDLNYGCSYNVDGCIYYPYTCNSCGFEGEEWYNLSFTCHKDAKR